MARSVKALNNTQIEKAKPSEKLQSLFDGGGLYLEIKPSGVKTWRMKCKVDSKSVLLTFGHYPVVSLAEAIRKHHHGRTS